MKKGKETVHQQSSPAIPKVDRRDRKRSLTLRGFVKMKVGSFIKAKKRFYKVKPDSEYESNLEANPEEAIINLKIVVSPEDWEKLWWYCLDHFDDFAKELWRNVIYPKGKEFESKKGARGKHKYRKAFVQRMKTEAGWLFPFFSFWCKLPLEKWPDYLKKLLTMAKKDEHIVKRNGKYDPQSLTEYSLTRIHGKDIEKFKLRPFNDPFNFYLTYIQTSNRPQIIQRQFIEGKTPKEVETLPFSQPTLRVLFKSLQLI